MEIQTDGAYGCTINEYQDTDYLRFYPDGSVIYGRALTNPENLMRWFGRNENEHYDGRGTYNIENEYVNFDIKTDHTVFEYNCTLTKAGLQCHLRWREREANNLYRFLPLGFERHRVANQQEITAHAAFKELELPPYLRDREGAWWALANRRGWFCRQCEKLIMIGERECYFDTGYCSGCCSNMSRGLFY